jgi:hypothetical protein
VIDATVIAAAALLVAGAGAAFAVSVRVGMLLGRRMDRALEARQDADDSTPSDQAPDVGEEVGIDE